jgi:preprotein translocase subunit YajC
MENMTEYQRQRQRQRQHQHQHQLLTFLKMDGVVVFLVGLYARVVSVVPVMDGVVEV